jgi:outer membrane protein TolC
LYVKLGGVRVGGVTSDGLVAAMSCCIPWVPNAHGVVRLPTRRIRPLLHVPLRLLGLAAVLLGLTALALPVVAQDAASADAAAPLDPDADTVRVSVTAAMRRALDVSPDVEERRALLARAEARSDEARFSRFFTDFTLNTAHSGAPSLNIPEDAENLDVNQLYLNPEVENDWDDLRFFSAIDIRARQPILTWGELRGTIRAARFGVDVEAAAVRRQALDAAFRTGELYYNVLLTDALSRLVDETGEVVRRAEREVQRLLDEGDEDVDDADLFRVKLTKEEFRRRRVEVRERRALARTALRRQLFLGPATDTLVVTERLQPLDVPLPPDSLAYVVNLALAHRPELDQAEAGIAAREAQVDVAQSDYYPKLGLQLSYAGRYAADRFRQESAYVNDPFVGSGTETGFGIRLNLNFLQTRARVEQAKAQANRVRHQRDGAQQLIRVEAEQALREFVIEKANYQSRERALQTTEEWLRTEQINFDLELGNTENLIEAVEANLQAEAAYFEAVHRYNTSILRLLRATGVLADRARAGMLVDPSRE